ncbi:MAG TPA: S24 family peptidase [Thermoanaerobaculia bacterium]|nr:S24 family peptidase [Thermoanaerobaculia bacterium]
MAIAIRRGGSVRDIRALAARVYQRWLVQRRRQPGKSVPVDDTLSRLFEHVPEYRPGRRRSAERQNRPSKSPGIFKLQQIAEMLDTTVGDLLDEPGYRAPRELLSLSQRRTLRDAARILHDLFELDDPALATPDPPSPLTRVAPAEFIERDYDYPRPLHAWVVPEIPATAGSTGAEPDHLLSTAHVLHSVREIWDTRLQVIRVIGDSMAPELRHGWKVLLDTQRRQPAEGDLIAVYVKDEGGILGRWHTEGGNVLLRKTNPDYAAVELGAAEEWIVCGVVTTIVEAPVPMTAPSP